MNYIPNISPEAFSMSAIIVAYLLIDDTTSKEQNALGNWFLLLGQTLCTNATHRWVLEERGNYQYSSSRTPNTTGNNTSGPNVINYITSLEKAIIILQQEVEKLKANNKPT